MPNYALAIRRKFKSPWDEVQYLYLKLLHWFYGKQLPAKARPYAARLQRLLKREDSDQESILGQECRSLICELRGDLVGAIRHREAEIRRIRRLHGITSEEQWDVVCACYDYNDLSDRLDILALLYDQIGETDRAIRILRESKAYCARHGIRFDGQDILDELLSDIAHNGKGNGRGNGSKRD
jgi:hypothetical protein